MLKKDVEEKRQLMRSRLDALHYYYPFTIDSLQLIEKLVTDILEAKNKADNSQYQLKQSQANQEHYQKVVEPLKNDNLKLTAMNNQLHLEMIKIKEDSEQQYLRWERKMKQIQEEKQDFQFLIERKNDQIKKKGEYINQFTKSTNKLIEKVQGNPSYSLIQSELTTLLKNASCRSVEDDTQLFDQLKEADEKVIAFRNKMQKAIDSQMEEQQKVKYLEQQVANRESEIKRLQNNFYLQNDEGKLNKLSCDYEINELTKNNERLNEQLDFLTKENFNQIETIKSQQIQIESNKSLKNEKEELTTRNRAILKQFEKLNKRIKKYQDKLINQKNQYEKHGELYQTQIERLKDQIKQEGDINKQLQKKIAAKEEELNQMNEIRATADSARAAYQSDKKALYMTVDQFNRTNEGLQETVEKMKQQTSQNQMESEKQLNEINSLKCQVRKLEREIELQKQSNALIMDEYKVSTGQISKLNEQICELENQNLQMLKEKYDFKSENEKLRKSAQKSVRMDTLEFSKTNFFTTQKMPESLKLNF